MKWLIALSVWVVSSYPKSAREVTLRKCFDEASVLSKWPADEDWPLAIRSWNMILQPQPFAVAYPENLHEVSAAVKCIRSSNLKISPRSGGHSYMGYGSGGPETVVIDLHALDMVVTDVNSMTLYTGPAVRMLRLRKLLDDKGLAFPIGQCSLVAVGAWALGGGLPSVNWWGFGVDNLLSTQVVLADGSIVTASEESYPDLFWALRGGCGSLGGIVTWLKFRMYRPPDSVTAVSYTFHESEFGQVLYNIVSQPQKWMKYLKWVEYHNNHPQVIVKARVPGADTKDVKLMTSYQQALGNYTGVYVSNMPWHEWFLEAFEPPFPNIDDQRIPNSELKETYVRKFSWIMDEQHFPPLRVLNKFADMMQNAPVYIDFELISLSRPEIEDHSKLSWPHHNATFLIAARIKMGRPLRPNETTYFEQIRNLLKPYTRGTSYCNYMDGFSNWPERFFGQNLKPLKQIQMKYDPDGVFDHPQSLTRVDLNNI